MCTALTWNNGDFYFGRNMDIGYNFGERVVVTPRGYEIRLKTKNTIRTKYAIIGMASVVENYPLYAEAMNEKGLCIAGLNFPNNAYYPPHEVEGKHNITPYELTLYLLGCLTSTSEARVILENVSILGIRFRNDIPLATLHFMLSDRERSIVVEQTREGLKIYDNPLGVMTNNPTFDFHLTNLNNYLSCSPIESTNHLTNLTSLAPLGHGSGGLGLPGDSTTVSRFVRTVFNKSHSFCTKNEEDNLSHFFHMLDNVSVVRGCAVSLDNTADYTTYASCMNVSRGIFYYKTYENNRITAIRLTDKNSSAKALSTYELQTKQDISFVN